MKKLILFIIITLSFQKGIEGKPLWTPIDNGRSKKCISITTIESNDNQYRAKIEIHGYYDSPITIGGTTYHQLAFDEPGTLNFVGEPALPIISRLIALPKGEMFDVRISDEKWTDNIFIGKVIPSQISVLETEKEPPFKETDSIYNGEVYQTKKVYIGDLQRWRDVNNRAINICPIRYMPRDGEMSILKEFVINISFNDTTAENPLPSKDVFLFLNQPKTANRESDNEMRNSTESYDYLIIAGNIPGVLECQALADFRKWKAFKGYRTKVVSTNTIGATDSLIKQYIINEYPKGVRHVLFIGDSNRIPLFYYVNNSLNKVVRSDYWYGCKDGGNDVVADLCIGRFATNNLSELTNMVNKTISYEGHPRSYGSEVLLVAHKEDAPNKYQGCSEVIRTHIYDTPVTFTTAYGASPIVNGDSATNTYVVNEINEGKNIINYRGHGKYNCWSKWKHNDENFYDSIISVLNNSTNDVYFCIACNNGKIDYNCFMETFMRSNHGAAGMIAATESTYTSSNHLIDQYLFSNLLNNNVYNIGELNNVTHIENIGATTGEEHEKAICNAFSYLCGCDPTLEILTGNTEEFKDYVLSLNGQNLTIECGNNNGYKVSVVNENDSLLFVMSSYGSSCTFPTPTENFYIVLNKHNYVPRVIYVNVADSFIQDKVFNNVTINNYYVKNSEVCVGYDVTTSVPYGKVSIERGSKLSISRRHGVFIKNGFECELGGELQIK